MDARLPLFLLACTSDLLDGAVARRLGSETRIGALLDASADFALVFAATTILTLEGIVLPLLLGLECVAFGQFIYTGRDKRRDPLGKHIGTVLFVALGVTLAQPCIWVGWWCSTLAAAYISASLLLRWGGAGFRKGSTQPSSSS